MTIMGHAQEFSNVMLNFVLYLQKFALADPANTPSTDFGGDVMLEQERIVLRPV